MTETLDLPAQCPLCGCWLQPPIPSLTARHGPGINPHLAVCHPERRGALA